MAAAPMNAKDAAELRRLVVAAVRHVLSSHGLDLAEGVGFTPDPDPTQIVALIGFAGRDLRGTLTVIAPTDLIRLACPPILGKAIKWEWEVFDWAGELANLMLGRIKVGLSAHGVEVDSSTPRVMRAGQLQGTLTTERTVCAACFPFGNAQLRVWFDAVGSAGRTLFEGTVDGHSPEEGAVILFD
jgi:CheY-specific phosphatase CheX